MRRLQSAALATLLASGCGASQDAVQPAAAPSHALSASIPQGTFADTSCQVVLRQTAINFEGRLGPQTDCSSGTCWVIVTATVDVAVAQDQAQAQPFILYQGLSGGWHQLGGTPVFGAAMGYRTYQFVLNQDTFTSGHGANTMQVIPFLVAVSGGQLWDHNRNRDPGANYQLVPSDNWTIAPDPTVCPASAPAGAGTLSFAAGWQNSSSGTLVPGGKLDVSYDIYRLAGAVGCTLESVPAFAIEASAQFAPGGAVQTERVNGPFDADAGVYRSAPLEFDVPAGATSVALWFQGSSDCGGNTLWDSNFGQNYVYPIFGG